MNIISTVISLVIVAWVIYRQLTPHLVSREMTLYLVLLLVGIVEVVGGLYKGKITIGNVTGSQAIYQFTFMDIAVILGTLLISAVFCGILRGLSYKLYENEKGFCIRRGTVVTFSLWIVSFAIHMIGEKLVPGSSALDIFYIGLSLLIQRSVTYVRAQYHFPAAMVKNAQQEAEQEAAKKAQKVRK